MLNKEATDRSILIVSSSERFDAAVKRPLKGFVTIDIRKSAAMARRCIMERAYDIVAICAPLPDETGEELALDVTDRYSSSVLFVAPQETYEDADGYYQEPVEYEEEEEPPIQIVRRGKKKSKK